MLIPNRILICSLGSIGSYYVSLIKKNWPEISLGVYRTGKGKICNKIEYVDKVFNSYKEAINWGPDACILSSPASSHLDQALIFAKSEIPLLIEKPVGISLDRLDLWEELIELNIKVPIFIGYIFRSNPCAHFLKQRLLKQDIGVLIEADFYCGSWLPDWRPSQNYQESVSSRKELGGGVLLELSHEIDLVLWLLGEIKIIGSNISNTRSLNIDVEDRVLITGIDSNNTLITIRLNFCTKPQKRITTFRGTKGELVWDIIKNKVTISRGSNFIDNKIFDISKDDIFKSQLETFFHAIDGYKNSLCTLKESLNVLEVIKQSYTLK